MNGVCEVHTFRDTYTDPESPSEVTRGFVTRLFELVTAVFSARLPACLPACLPAWLPVEQMLAKCGVPPYRGSIFSLTGPRSQTTANESSRRELVR